MWFIYTYMYMIVYVYIYIMRPNAGFIMFNSCGLNDVDVVRFKVVECGLMWLLLWLFMWF